MNLHDYRVICETHGLIAVITCEKDATLFVGHPKNLGDGLSMVASFDDEQMCDGCITIEYDGPRHMPVMPEFPQ